MLQVGDKLPEFKGLNQNGRIIRSKDYIEKSLVIFFYPKANTPGCTMELCNLRDNYCELKDRGYELLGVSSDNEKKQKTFSDKYNFPFDLIADTNKELIESFGVWKLKKFMGREFMGIFRTTFVFNEKGICVKVIDKVKTKDHARQLLE